MNQPEKHIRTVLSNHSFKVMTADEATAAIMSDIKHAAQETFEWACKVVCQWCSEEMPPDFKSDANEGHVSIGHRVAYYSDKEEWLSYG